MNRLEKNIVSLMLRSPSEFYSINGISKQLNEHYSYVHETIRVLEKKKIIQIKRTGRTKLCKINFSTASADLLAIASLKNKLEFLKKNPDIGLITEKIEQTLANLLYVMILFGSKAKGTAKKASDIDLFFIIQNKKDIENFKQKVNGAISDLNYEIHIFASTADWFFEMLGKKNSVGREVFENSMVLYGAEMYYNLVKKYDKESGYSKSN